MFVQNYENIRAEALASSSNLTPYIPSGGLLIAGLVTTCKSPLQFWLRPFNLHANVSSML